jgi:gliding motility-associated-like protein
MIKLYRVSLLIIVSLLINNISQAQCTITATASHDTICLGDTVHLSSTGGCPQYALNNNFNLGIAGAGWTATTGVDFSNPCNPTANGTTYMWMGSAVSIPRTLTTVTFDMVAMNCTGGNICFDLKYATQSQSSPCEGPDEYNEGVSLQYSTNGTTWTDIAYLQPDGTIMVANPGTSGSCITSPWTTPFTTWDNYCFSIPAAAITTTTQFRWIQIDYSSTTCDHWGMDNVEIYCSAPGQTVNWSHGPNTFNGGTQTPNATTTYTVTVTDGTGSSATDNVTVVVQYVQPPIPIHDTVCQGQTAFLGADPGVGNYAVWYDSPTGGTPIDTGNTMTVPNVLAPDTFWVETTSSISSGGGSNNSWTFDNDLQGWTGTTYCGYTDNWAWNTAAGLGTAYFDPPYGNSSAVLHSPVINIAGCDDYELRYRHKWDTESCCDHAMIAYRLDGGAWQTITPTLGAYSGSDGQYSEPLFGGCSSYTTNLYYGTGGYATHGVDFSFVGANTLELAFEFTSDGSVESQGWWLDSIGLNSACPQQSNACVSARIPVIIYIGGSSIITASNDTSICAGDQITIQASGGGTYNWSTGATTPNINVSPTTTTTYTVTIDNGGCSGTEDVIVTVNPLPIPVVSNDTTICNGAQTTLTASGGANYNWSNGGNTASINVSPSVTTTYTVTVDNSGCTATDNVVVTVVPIPIPVVSNDTTICDGGQATLTASGGANYNWSNGGNTATINVSPSVTTTYTVTVDNGGGCSATDDVVVTLEPSPTVDFTVDTTNGCEPLTVNFTDMSNGISYLWDFGDGNTSTAQNPTHTYQNAGTYSVNLEVGSANGCTNNLTKNAYIEVYPTPIASFSYSPITPNYENPTVSFVDQSINADFWHWNFGDFSSGLNTSIIQNPTHDYNQQGDYTIWLVVTSQYGCIDSTSKNITVIGEPMTLYIPNAFSPDDNGVNDKFMIGAHAYDPESYNIQIFDRWGKKVYESDDIMEGWNGQFMNTNDHASIDTYVFIINIKDLMGKAYKEYGEVNLIR